LNFLLALFTHIFAMMFKKLANQKTNWRLLWSGAVVTEPSFVLGQSVLAFHFGKAPKRSRIGVLSGIYYFLLFAAYYSVIVFFFN